MKEYSFTTYNIFKAHLPFARQVVGRLAADNDFVALQEWISSLHVRADEFIATCPTFIIPFRNIKTGTAVISKHKPIDVLTLTSKERELGFTTKKSMIITAHVLHNGTTLHIANIHSLNFVTNGAWKRQLDYFLEYLPKSGPLIFAGDFNTWHPWRFEYLENTLRKHRLHYANYDHDIVLRLDHIFTRDIEVLETKEANTIHTSDHYPVTLKFRI